MKPAARASVESGAHPPARAPTQPVSDNGSDPGKRTLLETVVVFPEDDRRCLPRPNWCAGFIASCAPDAEPSRQLTGYASCDGGSVTGRPALRDDRPLVELKGMAPEIRWADEHVVSPELVLVSSPEEARRARESLPAAPWLRPRGAAASPTQSEPNGRHLRLVHEISARPSSRRFPSLVSVIPLLAAIAVAGYAAERFVGQSATPSEFIPARAWSWPARPGASGYDVTIYRDRRIVFRARTSKNHVLLQRAFRFQAGRYRWTVQSVPLQQGEPSIVDSTFVLSAGAAGEANVR
jgi:hypothetical protein